jgi:hypothetical protein
LWVDAAVDVVNNVFVGNWSVASVTVSYNLAAVLVDIEDENG